MITRNRTRRIYVGAVPVGGGAPVSVQSMTNTDTRDADSTLAQIFALHEAGCDIVRVAVPDMKAAARLREIAESTPIPVIADIHFDYRLALKAIESGVHGIRINPGNIGDAKKVAAVAKAVLEAGICIRVGANSGSLHKKYKNKGNDSDGIALSLVNSALEQCRLLEKYGVEKIKVSLKSSNVVSTVLACQKFAEVSDYPQHIGITEAGTLRKGIIKSSVGIGSILLSGIGDTIRVSLTANPVEEVKTGIMILESIGLRAGAPEIVSCPTCGRTEVDLIGLASQIESEIERIKSSGSIIGLNKIAVMGCVVNGPGEASDADLGIAGGKGRGAIFRKGKLLKTVHEKDLFEAFMEELRKYVSPRV